MFGRDTGHERHRDRVTGSGSPKGIYLAGRQLVAIPPILADGGHPTSLPLVTRASRSIQLTLARPLRATRLALDSAHLFNCGDAGRATEPFARSSLGPSPARIHTRYSRPFSSIHAVRNRAPKLQYNYLCPDLTQLCHKCIMLANFVFFWQNYQCTCIRPSPILEPPLLASITRHFKKKAVCRLVTFS